MELTAVIQALNWMKAHNLVEVILYSDSQYVLQGITQWMTNWKRRGWMTASNDPVKNRELWQELDRATIGLKIDWRWIRGHSGDINNDRVDFLARQQALNGGRTHASY